MSKKALFYTDPLAALWMVRAFRLKVQAGPFCLQPESAGAFLTLLAGGLSADRLVVSADTAHLLEPKAGDVVEEVVGGKVKFRRLAAKDFPLTGTAYRILERGGRPFFPPESAGG